jgi:hypothetical protein
MAEAAIVTEERRAEFKAKITAFITSSDEKVAFPASLTIEERKVVHDLAYNHNLCKRSRGPKNNGRFIEVSKPTDQQKVQLAEQKKRRESGKSSTASTARPPILVEPLGGAITTTWDVPGSKSMTNRGLVLAALSEGTTELLGVLHSDDTRHMANALRGMGIEVENVGETTRVVRGGKSKLRVPDGPLFIGNSGTTVRFLAALAALVPGPVTFEGAPCHSRARARAVASRLRLRLRRCGVIAACVLACRSVKAAR